MAFTCLGTGDEGSFYSDSAAQIAIQEVCNFLRTHLNSKFPVIDQVNSNIFINEPKWTVQEDESRPSLKWTVAQKWTILSQSDGHLHENL